MKKFTCVQDIGDLKSALAEAFEIKKERFKYVELGRNKTLMMIFFNSSLRTRLSTQKAALNLGMNVMVLDINQGAWKLETERGVIMDGDKPEHILEAIPVMGCYCDIIGVRSFARFEDRDFDYQETIINQFIQHSGRPVFSMEAATRHPLQSFADLITIEEYKKTARPKVVMTWAPHPRPLPQAVPNSFAEWMNATDYEFIITHPEGYELDPQFVGNAKVEYDQMKAFEGADFIYAKNWAAYSGDNYGQILSKDRDWTVSDRQMAVTNNAYFMHCLPVRRNMIVTDDVIESPQSIVIPEAANREISATVVLKRFLENMYAMIKKKLSVILLCLFFAGVADAQEKNPQVIKGEPQVEDIYNVLEAMDVHIFRFDLKEFLNNVYAVNIYIDEYEEGKSPKQVHSIRLGTNIQSLNGIPEEHRQAFRELKQVPEGKDEWEAIKEMAVYFRKSNDSTAVCTVNVPGGMKGGVPLQLRPIEKFHSYIYYPRPFKFQAVEKADHFRIPLALYGSAWLDKQHDFIRFCGEREIDPGMKSEILKDIPHYYVIGIEFKSAKN